MKRANVRTTSCSAGDVKPKRNDMKRPTLKRPVNVDLTGPHYNQDGRALEEIDHVSGFETTHKFEELQERRGLTEKSDKPENS